MGWKIAKYLLNYNRMTQELNLKLLDTLTSGRIRRFSRQKKRIACGFAHAYFRRRKRWRVVQRLKRCGKSHSMHLKKIFGWELQIFCEWCHNWRTSRPPRPTSPVPGLKLLDGSISLKFSLETRLQSESFDTLDDLLGFRVQKLSSKY